MSDFDKKDEYKKNVKAHSEEEEFKAEHGALEDEALLKVHSQLMREKAEPREQNAPIPIFVLLLCGILLFWGGFYLSRYSGGFKWDSYNPEAVGGQVKAVAKAEFKPVVQGKKLFTRTCQQCHQPDGKGLPGVYPPLVGSHWLLSDETRAIKILLKGLSGPVEIEGQQFDGNMPSMEDWKDRDIAAVLTYERQSWGNNGSEISEELVKKVREEIKDRTKPWTGEEILKENPL